MAWITAKPSGRAWLVVWREGGRKRRKGGFRSLEEAEAFKAELEGAPALPWWADLNQPDPSDPLFAHEKEYSVVEYLTLKIERDRTLRQTTRDTYAHSIRDHIAPKPLGKMDVRAVSARDIQDFWDGLTRLGPGALRNVRQLLSKAFNAAYREGIREDNPMHRAHVKAPPKRRATEVIPLTVDEIERLADGAASARDRVAILVMAYGGLRAGEIGGLRRDDVDTSRSQLRLRQQVVVTRTGKQVAPLKTAAARRIVSIPRSVTDELAALLPDAAPDGLIFHTSDGAMWGHQNVGNAVQRAAKRAGMRPVHPHALRHTAVSLWIEDGASPVDVQHMVGHSSITMTLGTYSHLFTYGGAALADSMERRRSSHNLTNSA